MTAIQQANGTAAAPGPARRPNIRANGDFATSEAWGNVYEAAAYEEAIRIEADAIWDQAGVGKALDREIFRRLYPLLRKPIHPGHIIATSRAKGKPYDSDGVRSAQVLIDRMNNVLGPMFWRIDRTYHADGKLCRVIVRVVDGDDALLAEGESYGGMDRANTLGNQYKASFTNAAKIAFAAIGPGHEIYCQAIDYDPDLLPGAIEDQNKATPVAAAARPAQPATQPARPEVDYAKVVADLLEIDDDLAETRLKAVQAFKVLGATDRQIARDVGAASANGRRDLESLVTRVNNAINAQTDPPPEPPAAEAGAAS